MLLFAAYKGRVQTREKELKGRKRVWQGKQEELTIKHNAAIDCALSFIFCSYFLSLLFGHKKGGF